MTAPNILVFMTDQQRWDTVPPFSRAKMPHLEAFGLEGLAFTRAYCPSPHCCPSRATFFSGLYPTEHGVWNNVQVANALSRGPHPSVRFFSDDLQEAGYQLFFNGKWHVSSQEGPADRGWVIDEVTEPIRPAGSREPNDYRQWAEWEGYKMTTPRGEETSEQRQRYQILRPGYGTVTLCGIDESPFRDRETVEAAVDQIHARKNRSLADPWCHFIGTLGPHDPYCVPQAFLDWYDPDLLELPPSFVDTMEDKPALYRRTRSRFDQLTEAEHREAICHYLAFCSYEDHLFGQVLQALADSGQSENTLVVYLSDHGDYMGDHGLWAKGLPCFQAAYRIPALVRWPQQIAHPGRTVDAFVSLADFAPTFLEVAGLQPQRPMSGESLAPFFRGEEKPAYWRDAQYTQTNGNELYGIQRSVTTDQWKYVYNGFDYDELYHLQTDPDEMHNLASDPQYQSVVRTMCQRLWQFAYDHNDTCINPYVMVALAPFGPGILWDGV